ncbi:peroxidase 72-like [Rutidosis leptorrhynchoides]|uniref:peroxidase 72-like n=1 Tax=Rutidosis leptorrhynchoides TaxID=125765 RepID=UPI003A9A1A16
MARSATLTILFIALMTPTLICFSKITNGGYLYPQFYYQSCPQATSIIRSIVAQAIAKDSRMAASLLRLHFHDCFVKGCDASILLDNDGAVNDDLVGSLHNIVSEKGSVPNTNSVRGFEVIDDIKAALETACPQIVSCADILALAARDSIVLAGGPSWEVPVGRRDSLGASLHGSNRNIPAPNNTLQTIITKFKLNGLDITDLVALSGAHTIGNARCTSFKQRLYGNKHNDQTDKLFAAQLQTNCPRSGGDENLFFLDYVTPMKFDNSYYRNLMDSKGLLTSDQILFKENQETMRIVKEYADNQDIFFEQFSKSMIKMGNISPLTGFRGQIRKSCRMIEV